MKTLVSTIDPFHRLHVLLRKLLNRKSSETQHISNSVIGGSVTQVRNVKGNVQL